MAMLNMNNIVFNICNICMRCIEWSRCLEQRAGEESNRRMIVTSERQQLPATVRVSVTVERITMNSIIWSTTTTYTQTDKQTDRDRCIETDRQRGRQIDRHQKDHKRFCITANTSLLKDQRKPRKDGDVEFPRDMPSCWASQALTVN